MKKIDTWLDVQRFVLEASTAQLKLERSDVQFLSRPRRTHSRRLIKVTNQFV